MALARMNLPAWCFTAGRSPPALSLAMDVTIQDVSSKHVARTRAGRARAELRELEMSACPSSVQLNRRAYTAKHMST